MGDCTVYGLREIGSDEFRYVGQTRKDLETRLKWHWYDANAGGRTKRANWMRSAQRRGVGIEVVALEENAEINAAEVRWISELRASGERLLNMTDGGDEGVLLPGAENANAKIDDETVLEIFSSPERGDVVAQRFGVSKGTVSMIRRGRTWTHLTAGQPPKNGRKTMRRFFSGQTPTEEGREVAKLYQQGWSRDLIADRYGTTPTTVTNTLAAMGVQRRPGGVKRRPLRLNGKDYPGVLAAMRGEGCSHAHVMKHAEFLE